MLSADPGSGFFSILDLGYARTFFVLYSKIINLPVSMPCYVSV
jgi:hypothetical protein